MIDLPFIGGGNSIELQQILALRPAVRHGCPPPESLPGPPVVP